jgi:hypothetical protein
VPAISLCQLLSLRLALGLVALLGAFIFLQAVCWDIQWHGFIGRDRTLIPPHILMLSGLAISGIVALLMVLIESRLARRDRAIAQQGILFAGLFHAPLGAYMVGYSALLAAAAFPLDAYWHALYGMPVGILGSFPYHAPGKYGSDSARHDVLAAFCCASGHTDC